MLSLPSFTCQMFGEILGSNAWLANKPGEIPFYIKGLSSDIANVSCAPYAFQCLDSSCGPLTSVASSLAYVAPDAPNQKECGMVVDLWSIGWNY